MKRPRPFGMATMKSAYEPKKSRFIRDTPPPEIPPPQPKKVTTMPCRKRPAKAEEPTATPPPAPTPQPKFKALRMHAQNDNSSEGH